MRAKSIKSKRQVTVLKNPKPRFVSFVDHGANQEPFNVVKRQNGDKCMPVKAKKVAKPKTSKKAETADIETSANAAVLKITFPKSTFKNAKAVEKWMDDNKWEDYQITKTAKGFVVKSTSVDAEDLEDIREVTVDDELGVKSFVGKMKADDEENEDDEDDKASKSDDDEDDADEEDEGDDESGDEDDEEDENASKSDGDDDDDEDEDDESDEDEDDEDDVAKNDILDAVVSKYDYYDAWTSNGKDLVAVLKDGSSDGVPPGFDEVLGAVRKALGNSLKEDGDHTTAIKSIAAQFGDAVSTIHAAWKTVIDTGDKTAKKAAKRFNADMAAFITDEPAELVVKTEAKPVKKTATPAPVTAEAIAELVSKSVTSAVTTATAPLTKTVKSLKSTVAKQEEQLSAQAELITKFQKGSPARKSMLADDLVEQEEDDELDEDEDYIQKRTNRGMYGGVS